MAHCQPLPRYCRACNSAPCLGHGERDEREELPTKEHWFLNSILYCSAAQLDEVVTPPIRLLEKEPPPCFNSSWCRKGPFALGLLSLCEHSPPQLLPGTSQMGDPGLQKGSVETSWKLFVPHFGAGTSTLLGPSTETAMACLQPCVQETWCICQTHVTVPMFQENIVSIRREEDEMSLPDFCIMFSFKRASERPFFSPWQGRKSLEISTNDWFHVHSYCWKLFWITNVERAPCACTEAAPTIEWFKRSGLASQLNSLLKQHY